MPEGLKGIIEQLERQQIAIGRALEVLRDVEGLGTSVAVTTPVSSPAARKTKSKNRRSEGQKARWAAKKAAEAASTVVPEKVAPRKGGVTDEGRKRLADAMKRRWAVKRAASAVKKTVTKKRAAK